MQLVCPYIFTGCGMLRRRVDVDPFPSHPVAPWAIYRAGQRIIPRVVEPGRSVVIFV